MDLAFFRRLNYFEKSGPLYKSLAFAFLFPFLETHDMRTIRFIKLLSFYTGRQQRL